MAPGDEERREIAFRFGVNGDKGSIIANDFRPVSCVGARGRASHLRAAHFETPARSASLVELHKREARNASKSDLRYRIHVRDTRTNFGPVP
jgi:hypothetical protein